jgi:hypothetical protein
MIVGVQGTPAFQDYNVFMRAMGVALSGMKDDDKELLVYTFGPVNINGFTAEFCNLSERGMKARGKRIRFFKVPTSWGTEHMNSIDYFAFFSLPKESYSNLMNFAEAMGVESGVFRY